MATPVIWNPGEPVFDQATGEPYIDAEGALVEVYPGLKVEAADGRVLDGDDVANAAYYRANLFEGEALRDASAGVPYLSLALGQDSPIDALDVVVSEVRSATPGIAGIVDARVVVLDPATRVLLFTATMLRAAGGGDQALALQVGGG